MALRDALLEKAKKAADAIHGDTSVERGVTISRLEDLVEHVNTLLDSVDTEINDDAHALDDDDEDD